MNKSKFQSEMPLLKELNYKINEFDRSIKQIDIENSFSINIQRVKNETSAIVSLTIKIGTNDSKSPFYINGTISSKFHWLEDAYDDDTIDILLKTNAPSFLLSYFRPIISNLTNYSHYPPYNIPLIDFSTNIDV